MTPIPEVRLFVAESGHRGVGGCGLRQSARLGLNIYVAEDDRCTDFYRSVAQALKPEGIFVCSFITPPDQWQPRSAADLEDQRFLFKQVVPVKWSCVRDEAKTREQLGTAGFEVVSVTYDSQRMFPAVVAKKARQG